MKKAKLIRIVAIVKELRCPNKLALHRVRVVTSPKAMLRASLIPSLHLSTASNLAWAPSRTFREMEQAKTLTKKNLRWQGEALTKSSNLSSSSTNQKQHRTITTTTLAVIVVVVKHTTAAISHLSTSLISKHLKMPKRGTWN